MSTELAKRDEIVKGDTPSKELFVQPRFRTYPGAEAYELRVWMPGVTKQDVEVSLVDDQLTIIGRRGNKVPESWQALFVELGDHDYRLRVRLNIKVDQDGIAAKVENGVLHLTLPIHGEAKPRRIEVH